MTFFDFAQEVGNGKLIELRERAAPPFPAKRFGLEPLATAIGTGIVGAVTREKDAHVHLVGRLLQPAEKPLHAIPILRPLLAVLLAVAGLAVDDVGPLL